MEAPERGSIEHVLEAYRDAVHAKDVDAFVALYDEDVRVFDMWGRWSYEGAGAWREVAVEWFGSLGSERVAVELQDVQIIIGDRVAVEEGIGSGDQLRIVRGPRGVIGRPVDRRSELALGEPERAAERDCMYAPLVLCAGPCAGSQYQQLPLAWLEPGMAEDAGAERSHA